MLVSHGALQLGQFVGKVNTFNKTLIITMPYMSTTERQGKQPALHDSNSPNITLLFSKQETLLLLRKCASNI